MVADIAEALRAAVADHSPLLVFLAGPNGAGKSTFHVAYLQPLNIPFVNADVIRAQASLTDFDAFKAAEQYRHDLLESQTSFCTETVFSDPEGAKLEFLKQARAGGYWVLLIFIGLESADLSMARVVQRVEQGGHDVPDDKLTARFPRTLRNLPQAIPLVNEAYLFDNSSADTPFRPVAVYEGGALVGKHDPVPLWAQGLGLPGF